LDEPWLHELHAWGEFYVIVGGAAAALTGLMFVVVSIGPQTVSTRNASAIRAFITPTVVYFTTVLVAAAFMTMPAMTPGLLSALLALGGLAGVLYIAWIRAHQQWRESKLDLEDWIGFVGLPILGYVIVLAASIALWLGHAIGLEIVAVAMILFLIIGIHNAWDLVIWMAQQPRT
jgi:hypothetical protein